MSQATTSHRGERRHKRHSVQLRVDLATSNDVVTGCTEDVSAGGMFVRCPQPLDRLARVELFVDLPGHGTFKLEGRIVHVRTGEMSAGTGRPSGAGIEIIAAPPGFEAGLQAFLLRLTRRGDYVVLADSFAARHALQNAGYQARRIPPVAELPRVLAESAPSVIGVVVREEVVDAYRDAAVEAGAERLVHGYRKQREIGAIVSRLDDGI